MKYTFSVNCGGLLVWAVCVYMAATRYEAGWVVAAWLAAWIAVKVQCKRPESRG